MSFAALSRQHLNVNSGSNYSSSFEFYGTQCLQSKQNTKYTCQLCYLLLIGLEQLTGLCTDVFE